MKSVLRGQGYSDLDIIAELIMVSEAPFVKAVTYFYSENPLHKGLPKPNGIISYVSHAREIFSIK
jgi:hypothetical protein